MSSVVLVSPIAFGVSSKARDNALIQSVNVSSTKADMDRSQLCVLISELETFFAQQDGMDVVTIHQAREPKTLRALLETKGESVCVADSLSFHDIVDDDGNIKRRLIVFYPMSPPRQGELAREQIVHCITAAAESSASIELIDLRPYEEEGKYLEGSGSLIFAPGGRFVYMMVSQRSNPEVLETLCAEENINIPAKNRFLLRCEESVPHTNVLGWCGTGICAWAKGSLAFDNNEDAAAFDLHLSKNYSCVLDLSAEEMRGFAGSALEIPLNPSEEGESRMRHALIISESGLAALSPQHREALMHWYGANNIHTFYGEVLERRCGTSLPSCIAASYTHGRRPPAPQQRSTVAMLKLGRHK